MTERMVTEAHWGYYAFVLANAEVAEKGKLACFDTANAGVLVKARTAPGLLSVGIFAESMTGDGVKRCQVKLHDEVRMTWWDNGANSIALADRGKLCYLKDETTVQLDGTGGSVAGLIMDVNPTKGVLVHFGYKSW